SIVTSLVAASLVSGCSNLDIFGPKADDTYIEGTVQQLYSQGQDLMRKRDYKQAAKYFSEVDRQHPYSTWAAWSQLMVAYAYYKAKEYHTARLTLNRFLSLHPAHKDVAYAHYLKALSYFEEVRDTKRDQNFTRRAYTEFMIVAERYPTSKYAVDSRQKATALSDHLAGHEMEIGRFYQSKDLYLSAINRFKTVIKEYQTSRHMPEALHRMTESYIALGLRNEARRTAAVLGHNFPKSRWYSDSLALLQGKRSSPINTTGITTTLSRGQPKTPAKTDRLIVKSTGRSWFGRMMDRIF
ncbi:MAG: outer membrane protein assembly factor BamD, partial [Rhodospirillaceae bacterium]|nr:outer membrane protein assembly factor BamD [Rhodospirillaceae bacterium]